ncbi:MAG: sporulation integral membrane protein YtvI [Ruminococcaceae bacterium]|nr:sporulation integral membrane protein YtvI [Oscillospiraceae bacterium]
MRFKQSGWRVAGLALLGIVLIVAIILFLPTALQWVLGLFRLFLPFILGYAVSLLINPLADKLQKRLKLPRALSAILVIVLTVGCLGGIITAVIWKIVDEVKRLYEQFPMIYENAKLTWQQLSARFSAIYVALPENVQEMFDHFGTQLSSGMTDFAEQMTVVEKAGNFAKRLPSVFIGTIVFILSLFFMTSDAETVQKALRRVFGEWFMTRIGTIKQELRRYLGGYVKAQLTIMSVAFVILFVGLSILNIDYALLIALGIAVLDALPFFGSGAVLWPWTIISFINGMPKIGVGLLIIYLILVLCRQLIEPKIVSSNVGMHPILTLMAMYIGYKTLSIGGMLLGPIILMTIISFYRAGIFAPMINLLKKLYMFLSAELAFLKTAFQRRDG